MFLNAHWKGLAAADFFTVAVLNVSLVRYLVFFVIRLKSRVVEVLRLLRDQANRAFTNLRDMWG